MSRTKLFLWSISPIVAGSLKPSGEFQTIICPLDNRLTSSFGKSVDMLLRWPRGERDLGADFGVVATGSILASRFVGAPTGRGRATMAGGGTAGLLDLAAAELHTLFSSACSFQGGIGKTSVGHDCSRFGFGGRRASRRTGGRGGTASSNRTRCRRGSSAW